MRTNIVIDDELMAEALRVSGLKTKREVVETALREFVKRHDQSWMLAAFGSNPDAFDPEQYERRWPDD